jgi:sensor domain CHASE-containing protein/HPt (histidine-containing phosphotransfer) domain-containing protein
MNLKVKTLLFITLTTAVLLGGLSSSLKAIVGRNFAKIEFEETRATTKKTKGVISTVVHEFKERGSDWSDWTDLADYLSDKNKSFEESNLTIDQMLGINWHHIIIAHDRGEIVFAGESNANASELTPIPDDLRRLFESGVLTKENKTVSGFVKISNKLHLIASRPIKNSDHSPPKSPGHLITTREIGDSQIERIRNITFLDVSFLPLWTNAPDSISASARAALTAGASEEIAEQESNFVSYARFYDITNQDLFDLRIIRPRELRAASDTLLKALNLGLYFAAFLLAVVTLTAVMTGILRPLNLVLEGVNTIQQGKHTPVEFCSNDEVGALASAFNQMADVIAKRESALQLVLDSTGDGLVLMSPSGELRDTISAPALQWFGPTKRQNIAHWLPLSSRQRTLFELSLLQLADDGLPFEINATMLLNEFSSGQFLWRIRYHPVRNSAGALTDVLVVLTDASALAAAENHERESRELIAIGREVLRDRGAVVSFTEDADIICSSISTLTPASLKRSIHTLKGTAATLGIDSISSKCHEIETALDEAPERLNEAISQLQRTWDATKFRIESFSNTRKTDLEISLEEHTAFVQHLVATNADVSVVAEAESWRNISSLAALHRIRQQVVRVAERLDKDVDVVTIGDKARIPNQNIEGFLPTLIHVVRNAVDHGIESPDDRRSRGKPLQGRIELRAFSTPQGYTIEIADDGNGINWNAVHIKARRLGLPCATALDLERALFVDGLSTAKEVTDISGRGVGMAAVQAACTRAGGSIVLESAVGAGTRLRFVFNTLTSRPGVERVDDVATAGVIGGDAPRSPTHSTGPAPTPPKRTRPRSTDASKVARQKVR